MSRLLRHIVTLELREEFFVDNMGRLEFVFICGVRYNEAVLLGSGSCASRNGLDDNGEAWPRWPRSRSGMSYAEVGLRTLASIKAYSARCSNVLTLNVSYKIPKTVFCKSYTYSLF